MMGSGIPVAFADVQHIGCADYLDNIGHEHHLGEDSYSDEMVECMHSHWAYEVSNVLNNAAEPA